VVKLAQESAGRDDLLKQLNEKMTVIEFEFKKIGNGSTRAVFALPLGLVLKLRVVNVADFKSHVSGADARPADGPNAAELERSKAFPAFVPCVYGEHYSTRGLDEFDQSIDLLVCERVIPLVDFIDHFASALGSTHDGNLGVCPRTGRIMALDVGSAWSEGVEEALLKGEHYLQVYPFLKVPRW
jgi:hypothetical protein